MRTTIKIYITFVAVFIVMMIAAIKLVPEFTFAQWEDMSFEEISYEKVVVTERILCQLIAALLSGIPFGLLLRFIDPRMSTPKKGIGTILLINILLATTYVLGNTIYVQTYGHVLSVKYLSYGGIFYVYSFYAFSLAALLPKKQKTAETK